MAEPHDGASSQVRQSHTGGSTSRPPGSTTAPTGARWLDALASRLVDEQVDGVLVQSSSGSIVDYNPAACVVLDMTADQLSGRTSLDPEWQATDETGRPLEGSEHPAMRVLATGVAIPHFVMSVRAGGGSVRWLRVGSWPVDLDGERGAITQFTDITAEIESRSALEEALQHLQRHLLPPERPEIPGMQVHIRSRNVIAPISVGGDFCDVYAVSDDRFGFFIGDACGHDLDTIATTTVAHHTLRAAGLHLARPGRVLAWLDDTLLASPDTVYCSAIHGKLTRTAQSSFTVELANAGHPRPILIRDGLASVVAEAGGIVGSGLKLPEAPEVTFELGPGDQLVMYSDGLIESLVPRIEAIDFVHRLQRASDDGVAAIDLIDDLLAQAEEARDDTTALVFHVDGDAAAD